MSATVEKSVVPGSPLMTRSISRKKRALRNLLQPVLTMIVLILIWEAAVLVFDIAPFLLPPPSSVYEVFVANAGLLWTHNLVTLLEIVLGFGAALVGGVAIGVVLGTFRPIERAMMPVILFFQVVPKSALAPLLIVWAGVGMYSKIALVFLMCFFPIVVQVVAGVRSVNEELVFLGKSTAARKRDVFIHVTLPHSLPYFFAGVKVSLTLAVVGAVVAEFIASSEGIGYVLLVAFGRLDTPLVLAGLVSITILAMLLYAAAAAIERLVIPWHVSQRLSTSRP